MMVMQEQQQILLVAVVIGLVLIVFGLDWADRRRNQRTLDLLTQFISNPEVRRLATGVSDDTPVGMTFVGPDLEPEPDPHLWIPFFTVQEEMKVGAEWPFCIVEKWERNEIGETRFIDSRVMSLASEPL